MTVATAMMSCSETDGGGNSTVVYDESQVIKVGGVTRGDLVSVETTRAVKGEEDATLKEVLTEGLPVTYYLDGKADDTRTATLKLESDKTAANDSTYYSFNLTGTTTPATWLGNGGHVFHGIYIPGALLRANVGTEEDQSNKEDYYGALESYLCMPPNHQIQATVSYVRLPFTHRLARVVGYVLIDPELNTAIDTVYMENVQVLNYANPDSNPVWKTARKVYPHFIGNLGSMDKNMKPIYADHLYAYYNKSKATYLYPTTEGWTEADKIYKAAVTAGTTASCAYTQIDYGKAPCYDIIVRPTYTDPALVMYDEASSVTADETNSVGFVVKLKNGLEYRKTVEVDLDANYYMVVYLRISREKVDYQTAGSELWQTQTGNDGPYGLDNANDLRLSKAGGSWQRAYRIGSDNEQVTDGNKYTQQYVSLADWLAKLEKAVVDGDNWGDYFLLTQDIEIDTDALPENFVFAGHLDGRGYTVTLNGSRGYLFAGLNGTYDAEVGKANLHTETDKNNVTHTVPEKGYRAEVMNLKVKGGKLFSETAEADKDNQITGYVYNCKEDTSTENTEKEATE